VTVAPSGDGRPALTVLEGGVSNSRLSDTSVAFAGSGFDTVRLRFRRQEGAYHQAKAHHSALQARGELRRTVKAITIGAYPDGLVTVEGRLAALLHGEEDHRLLGADDFVRAPEAAADLFGLDLDAAPVGVGRADLASELRFTDGEEGLEFLRALSYVDIPWLKVGTEGGKRDRLETVYHRNMRGRSVALRCYDKGVESAKCSPGTWLRLERQRRWRKDQEGTVDDVVARGLGEAFVGRELRAVVAGDDAVTVCDPPAAADRLRELYAQEAITGEALHRLGAFVWFGSEGLHQRTAQRRAAELRRLGLALNPHEGGRTSVAVGEYLRAFAAAWAA
jgi:hypothetical protein